MGASNLKGLFFIGLDFCILIASVGLSSMDSWGAWFLGQLLMMVFCWHCFTTLHSCGHLSHFQSQSLNVFFGHLVSPFVWTPFNSWRPIHNWHHKWTGNPEMDPTVSTATKPPAPLVAKIVNFLWRIGFPIVSIFFTFSVFYNPKTFRKMGISTSKKRHILIASVLVLAIHFSALIFFPEYYFRYYFPGFFVYLMMGDIIVISNHAHIDMPAKGNERYPPIEQGPLSRDLIFPNWLSLGLFYHFNYHSYHHLYPAMPFYQMRFKDLNSSTGNRKSCPWWKWILEAKSMSLSDLVNKSYRDI
jgi:fatty acid desaturase